MHPFSLFLSLFLLFTCVWSFSEEEFQQTFTTWMHKYEKSYTGTEFQHRYNVFKKNMVYVNEWNSKNNDTILGLNLFADLSNEEYKNIYLMKNKIVKKPDVFQEPILPQSVSLPSSVDWQSQGAVTPIKNQGQCGSCWTFSTTGAVEGEHEISTGNLVSLSEQNILDCSTNNGNSGCNGGWPQYAFKYIIKNQGVDTEASYPYQGVQGTCNFNPSNVGATISSYSDVSPAGSENSLQNAVAQQPTSVCIDASHNSFQLYVSGVYYEPQCSTTNLDHAVLAVGYGTSNSGTPYWLVKNSWGTTWGIQGYIWMSRNRNNNCGIASSASYPTGTGSSSSASSYSALGTERFKSHGRKGKGFIPKDEQVERFYF